MIFLNTCVHTIVIASHASNLNYCGSPAQSKSEEKCIACARDASGGGHRLSVVAFLRRLFHFPISSQPSLDVCVHTPLMSARPTTIRTPAALDEQATMLTGATIQKKLTCQPPTQAAIAQLASRRSHSPKVVRSILTCRVCPDGPPTPAAMTSSVAAQLCCCPSLVRRLSRTGVGLRSLVT